MSGSAFAKSLIGLAISAFCVGGMARADEASGSVVGLVPAALAKASGIDRTLAIDGPVFMGDRIDTGDKGQVQLLFRDQTRMVVGPGSSLVIDAFVFQKDATVQQVSMNAVKGAFRFMTGSGPKQAYTIHTPTATIAVRGTQFDFVVGEDGTTSLALFEGGVTMCDLSGKCVSLQGGCKAARLSTGKAPERISSAKTPATLKAAGFPYLKHQGWLRRDFRVNASGCLPPKPKAPASPKVKHASATPPAYSPGQPARASLLASAGGPPPSGGDPDPGSPGGNPCGGSCGKGNGGNGTGNEGKGQGQGRANNP